MKLKVKLHIKVPITDQFLWDIYKDLGKAGDIGRTVLRPRRTIYDIYPESPIITKYRHIRGAERFSWLLSYLKKNNYIKIKNLEGKQALSLSKKGINKALLASFRAEKVTKRKDGKWIMVIFDIPQKHQKARLLLRSVLKNMGYKMFQQSVWVTPYDVSEKTEALLQHNNLDRYVRVFLTQEL
ncbi:MAG: CRISPR-associated endonuclease Cas2 [Candidatus Staskawiczbacteria bacterium]|nr:CRISPR-associated endonuclease Cas2 [Candidatus Staskawiczbacteria bacterium]